MTGPGHFGERGMNIRWLRRAGAAAIGMLPAKPIRPEYDRRT
jgi:hypothetical protein